MSEWEELSSDQRRRVRRAVGRGRRVDEPALAPAAVELARRHLDHPYRTVVPLAIFSGLIWLVTRIVIWAAFGREESWPDTLLVGALGAVLFSGVYLLIYPRLLSSRAVQAEQRNSQDDDAG